ncbi:High-affinity nickel transport protein nic1 [Cyphellophora attinorum]|uniref:High-affinity nickel transport protein nic1 n=1 Tax=Cyphellophora attinorum TaxID=1664694 RepID=A0A0N1H195_9EURO|nr:High-affinity nickel transport protein nic1 [Phialophora attinorum]KPI34466.1 High-affinity nickel transport protein nic1 [Phialophora attinorum]
MPNPPNTPPTPQDEAPDGPLPLSTRSSRRPLLLHRARHAKDTTHASLSSLHNRTPYLRHLPLPAILIILLLVLINLLVWAIAALTLTLSRTSHQLLGTAALAYSLGLRHALDADHISAIDLMTRRLIASGQRPVTVGTWFSLGHSTIVVITSIVVAATAAGVEKRFGGFGAVGGIVGTSVSAAFLLLLGIMNAYILYKLCVQMVKVIDMPLSAASQATFKLELGGGVLFRVLKRMFKLIDRPWKMYPLGVLFGLGFDTSSEIALLGISSIQGARGTSMWLILVFPVLFTAGMCLVDTMDGALMMGLYTAPMGMGGGGKEEVKNSTRGRDVVAVAGQEGDGTTSIEQPRQHDLETVPRPTPPSQASTPGRSAGEVAATTTVITNTDPNDTDNKTPNDRIRDPLSFLYYSTLLTLLTVLCALVIGTIQLLSLILNTAHPNGPFWEGVEKAGDSYEIIGGGICASFLLVGIGSVVCFPRFKRWVDRRRARKGFQADDERPQGEERYSDEVQLEGTARDEEAGAAAEGVVVVDEITEVVDKSKHNAGGRGAQQPSKKDTSTVAEREVVGESSR